MGVYNTYSNLLKKIAYQAVEPLVDIINTSLGTGIFPEDIKQTVMYPIFKQDSKT